uniref:Uncharacterized protein n=2 Tax=Meloidogyne TaxID=189290 RepID=A0A914KSI7_MELIC|nr:unnamed protein product [Meloidogyne enterolobii]
MHSLRCEEFTCYELLAARLLGRFRFRFTETKLAAPESRLVNDRHAFDVSHCDGRKFFEAPPDRLAKGVFEFRNFRVPVLSVPVEFRRVLPSRRSFCHWK